LIGGLDRGARLLEVVVAVRSDGREVVIHPMKMQPRCQALLGQLGAAMVEPLSYGTSRRGVELTDEVVECMADEADSGLDVSKLRRRPGRPSMGGEPARALPVRFDPELRRAIEHRAEAERVVTGVTM